MSRIPTKTLISGMEKFGDSCMWSEKMRELRYRIIQPDTSAETKRDLFSMVSKDNPVLSLNVADALIVSMAEGAKLDSTELREFAGIFSSKTGVCAPALQSLNSYWERGKLHSLVPGIVLLLAGGSPADEGAMLISTSYLCFLPTCDKGVGFLKPFTEPLLAAEENSALKSRIMGAMEVGARCISYVVDEVIADYGLTILYAQIPEAPMCLGDLGRMARFLDAMGSAVETARENALGKLKEAADSAGEAISQAKMDCGILATILPMPEPDVEA